MDQPQTFNPMPGFKGWTEEELQDILNKARENAATKSDQTREEMMKDMLEKAPEIEARIKAANVPCFQEGRFIKTAQLMADVQSRLSPEDFEAFMDVGVNACSNVADLQKLLSGSERARVREKQIALLANEPDLLQRFEDLRASAVCQVPQASGEEDTRAAAISATGEDVAREGA